MAERRPLILMSGGLDSTYLAYYLAKDGKSFDTLYVNGGQCKNKASAEEEAQKLIIAYLEKHYGVNIHRLHSYSNVRYANAPSVAFSQFMPWFVNALEVVNPRLHSSVQMGYVTGDQIVVLTPQIKTAWDLLFPTAKTGDFKVPLQFPLIDYFVSKTAILHEMPDELYRMTWVCELPNHVWVNGDGKTAYFPCGKCLACVGREVENMRRKLTMGRDVPLDNWMQAKVDYLAANDNQPPKEAPFNAKTDELIQTDV